MSDDFETQLLTDGGKWWEFLDPETYDLVEHLPAPTRSSSDQLDWSRRRETKRRGPVGFGYFVHCSDCGNPVPPDFTFCVRCGGEPRSRHPLAVYSLVIAAPETERARAAAVDAIHSAGVGLERTEVEKLFDDPPAVFNVTAHKDRMAAIVAKLAEVDVPARSFPVDDPSIPWMREAFESLVRQPAKFAACLALAIGSVLGAFYVSAFSVVLGLAALVAFGVHELRWYKNRYHLDVTRLLEVFTGFDAEMSHVARETLRSLSDQRVREHVTVCLMEYYSLTHQLRAHEPVYGSVLSTARASLRTLMTDVLALAHRYAKMDAFVAQNPVAETRQQIAELENDDSTIAAQTKDQTIRALRDQIATTQEMEAKRAEFRERIEMLAVSMEHLRTRVAAVRARPSEEAWREAEIETVLTELDAEFEVFEETFHAVG